eukprot:GHVU01087911.1.p1 GENE.GHVU01087911.1~~GHVU01087911.1.p1  ORF type:complete len:521 (+),score=62.25 GHVU01087911.1:298-1860(+)
MSNSSLPKKEGGKKEEVVACSEACTADTATGEQQQAYRKLLTKLQEEASHFERADDEDDDEASESRAPVPMPSIAGAGAASFWEEDDDSPTDVASPGVGFSRWKADPDNEFPGRSRIVHPLSRLAYETTFEGEMTITCREAVRTFAESDSKKRGMKIAELSGGTKAVWVNVSVDLKKALLLVEGATMNTLELRKLKTIDSSPEAGKQLKGMFTGKPLSDYFLLLLNSGESAPTTALIFDCSESLKLLSSLLRAAVSFFNPDDVSHVPVVNFSCPISRSFEPMDPPSEVAVEAYLKGLPASLRADVAKIITPFATTICAPTLPSYAHASAREAAQSATTSGVSAMEALRNLRFGSMEKVAITHSGSHKGGVGITSAGKGVDPRVAEGQAYVVYAKFHGQMMFNFSESFLGMVSKGGTGSHPDRLRLYLADIAGFTSYLAADEDDQCLVCDLDTGIEKVASSVNAYPVVRLDKSHARQMEGASQTLYVTTSYLPLPFFITPDVSGIKNALLNVLSRADDLHR